MGEKYTENVKLVLQSAEEIAKQMHYDYINPEHLLYGLATCSRGFTAAILKRNGLEPGLLIRFLEKLPHQPIAVDEATGYTSFTMRVLEEGRRQAEWFRCKMMDTEHLLLGILKAPGNIVMLIMNALNIPPHKVYVDTIYEIRVHSRDYQRPVEEESAEHHPETVTLDQYAKDITTQAREGKLDPVIGRDVEISRVIHVLSRRGKNNPCLIGEPGVGKTAIVEGLATRIVRGEVPEVLKDKRVVALSLSSMVAGTTLRGEFEERIQNVIREVIEAQNVLLFVDELHTIIGAGGGGAEGTMDASNILKPHLARGELRLIGATTISEYRKYIEKDTALERRFQPIMVEEPDEEEAIRILNGIAYKYEIFHEVSIPKETLKAAVNLSARYVNDRKLPDKAIDLIDEAAAARTLKDSELPEEFREYTEELGLLEAKLEKAMHKKMSVEVEMYRKQREELLEHAALRKQDYLEEHKSEEELVVTPDDVARTVSQWTGIPLQNIEEKESERYLKLEETLHRRVIGQDEAVEAVARAMRRGRVGLQDPAKPIGSFLFLGPTGVGKTELSKGLAESVFGSESAMIRLDMSEYMEPHSVAKIIGSPPGYVGFEDGGQLSEKVRNHPYSVILLDEIEKAHPDVFNILLQVLDDGHITDSKGRKVNFKNTVLIMTSNAGVLPQEQTKRLGFSTGQSKKDIDDDMKEEVLKNIRLYFKPEFLNRIDDTIVFHSLTQEEMHQILSLLLNQLAIRCSRQMDLEVRVSKRARDYIVENYTNLKMGARPLKRAVQSVIEDPLAEKVLRGEIEEGDTVNLELRKGKINFHVYHRRDRI